MTHKTHAAPELIERFVQHAEHAAAIVERVERSPAALAGVLRGVTAEADSVLLAEPDDLPPELFDVFREAPNVRMQPAAHELASADVGVTDAFAGVAHTGSVCVSITPHLGGAISLFPRVHVAVLAAETIVARPRDVFTDERLAPRGLERDFVFVTGPSATADMGPLVRGVHGPGRLHIIILE